jgi:hypothetical protein
MNSTTMYEEVKKANNKLLSKEYDVVWNKIEQHKKNIETLECRWLIRARKAGLSITDIGKIMERTPGHIYDLLRKYGIYNGRKQVGN